MSFLCNHYSKIWSTFVILYLNIKAAWIYSVLSSNLLLLCAVQFNDSVIRTLSSSPFPVCVSCGSENTRLMGHMLKLYLRKESSRWTICFLLLLVGVLSFGHFLMVLFHGFQTGMWSAPVLISR